jgi:hypothetical protein
VIYEIGCKHWVERIEEEHLATGTEAVFGNLVIKHNCYSSKMRKEFRLKLSGDLQPMRDHEAYTKAIR